ncbi:MAG: nicotinate-nucleotide adenylyltransferase [Pseudomonadota bacterium]
MWFAGPARLVPEAGRPRVQRLGFSLKPGMRVGLYGGSFNPAHEGHAHVAETAQKALGLDRVIWLVSPQNPLKASHDTEPLAARMAGASGRARGPGMIVSDAEARIGSQFTIDTIRVLKARFPGVRFVWIMGADSLAGFHRWKGWTQIMRELPVAVVSRPWAAMRARLSPAARRFAHARRPAREARLLPDMPAPAWVFLRGRFNFASSTAIRERQRRTLGTDSPGTGRDNRGTLIR